MAVAGDPRGFYEILGLPRSASLDDIRAAFRERAKLWHPDSGKAADLDRFRLLNEAYEVLRDPRRRLDYDALRASPGGARRIAAAAAGPWAPAVAALAAAIAIVTLLWAWSRADVVAGLEEEIDGLRSELEIAQSVAVDAAARLRGADVSEAASGEAAPAGNGVRSLAHHEVSFEPGVAEPDEALRLELTALARDLQARVADPAPGGDWRVLVAAQTARAAEDDRVVVDDWALGLTRAATVTDALVLAGIPADRVAVRFDAGLAAIAAAAPDAAVGTTVAIDLVCCLR